MKRYFLILFFLSLTLQTGVVHAQPVTWEKLYTNGAIFRGIQTKDGGYAAVGTTRIQNQFKIFVIKTNSAGETLWNKIFGSSNNGLAANWIEESYDNGFIIAGYDGSGIGGDAYLLNIDSSGKFKWSRSYGGNGLEQALRVLKTIDGGYIIGARAKQNLFVIKTDSMGLLQWQKIYISNGLFGDLILVENTGYLLMGLSGGNNLMRLDLNGDTIWTKNSVGNSIGKSLRRLSDGTLIIGGGSSINECIVTKTDSIGNLQWEINYPRIGREIIYDLEILTNNRGYLISGSTDSAGNDFFRAMIRVIDLNGNVKFINYYTPSFYITDYAEFRSGIPTSDGGFYLSGSIAPISTGIAYMVKTDSLGNFKTVGITNNEINVPEVFTLYQNYPNPFNPVTTIKFDLFEESIVAITIYDNLGKEINNILNSKIIPGSYSVNWNAEGLSSGLYLYNIKIKSINSKKSISKTKSMILIK